MDEPFRGGLRLGPGLLAAILAAGCVDLRAPVWVGVDAASDAADGGVEPVDGADGGGDPVDGLEDGAFDPPEEGSLDGPLSSDAAVPTDGGQPDGPLGVDAVDGSVPAEGLALHWRFDEAEGQPARDDSGFGFAGTYVGAGGGPRSSGEAAPVTFANPASRSFDGASRQAVVLAGMPALLRPTTELTLAAWFRATALDPASGSGEVVSGGNNYLLRVRAGDVEISKRVTREGGNQHVRCFAPASGHLDGAWHHVAAVIDATRVFIYVDGVLGCALANAEPFGYDQGTDLWVGRHPSNENYDWNGQIDDVRIYTRPLSAAEIAALAARAQ